MKRQSWWDFNPTISRFGGECHIHYAISCGFGDECRVFLFFSNNQIFSLAIDHLFPISQPHLMNDCWSGKTTEGLKGDKRPSIGKSQTRGASQEPNGALQ